MKQKDKTLKQLKLFYLLLFALGAVIIVPTHLSAPPTFMYARFPHYLEMMKPFLGFSWPETFKLYHYVIYALAIIGSLNILGIILPKFKEIALFSSLIGMFLIGAIVLFLFLLFINVNAPVAITYGLYFVVLLIVDSLTLKALITRQTKA